jgi:predicted ATPase
MANGIPNHHCRIVLTGGPGGGKTTAADLMRREVGERIVIVPEAATMLFSGGFPRNEEVHARLSAQKAIYHVQRNLEDIHAALYPERILLCDRGTLDSVAYWPGQSDQDFYEVLSTTFQEEISRYDAVIFFETAAVGDLAIEGGNPARTETLAEAVALDRRLQEIWREHPNYYFIPHEKSFFGKLQSGLAQLVELLNMGEEAAGSSNSSSAG